MACCILVPEEGMLMQFFVKGLMGVRNLLYFVLVVKETARIGYAGRGIHVSH